MKITVQPRVRSAAVAPISGFEMSEPLWGLPFEDSFVAGIPVDDAGVVPWVPTYSSV